MDIFQSIVLALVQGISAWIPISSKTQVILVDTLFFGATFQAALAFALALHIGDLAAAAWKYWREYVGALGLLLDPSKLLKFDYPEKREREYAFLIYSIIATAIVALPLYELTKKVFAHLQGEWLLAAVGVLLIAMALATWLGKRSAASVGKQITMKDSLVAGAAQGLAVIPGISRSGISQGALLMLGVEPEESLRLSFMMSAPMIVAAFAAFFLVEGFAGIDWAAVAVGVVVAAIVSLLTMDFLTAIARKVKIHYFLAAVGILVLLPLLVSLVFPAVAGT